MRARKEGESFEAYKKARADEALVERVKRKNPRYLFVSKNPNVIGKGIPFRRGHS